ncbi:glycosyltransferase [Actinoallomurus sp. CA-142502]|uniref:glycosyltransferase n=1 Tax=Actinoallomurus sp. CA-142502 TaxID=3239885 RepID=UPI003D947A67
MGSALTVVIPTLNEEHYLPRLLDSLIRQKYSGELEVLVVDGGSSDSTVARAEAYVPRLDVRILRAPRADIGAQRNLGVRHASHDLLLFLDADVRLPARALAATVECVRGRNKFVLAVPHRTASLTLADIVLGAVLYFFVLLARLMRIPVTNGDFLLTTKSVHYSIGGFAEGAVLGEDTDYGIRAVKSGASYIFCFSAFVIASARRLQKMSFWTIGRIWVSASFHVLRHGPVYDRSRWEYPFGDYKAPEGEVRF